MGKKQVSTEILLTLTTFDDNSDGVPTPITTEPIIYDDDDDDDSSFVDSPTRELVVLDIGDDLANRSAIDEIVGDGRIEQFLEYIEHIDTDTDATDKLQFKEFLEPGTRMRYPSFNSESEKDDDFADLPIETNEDVETIEDVPKAFDSHLKRTKNSRKLNMFSYPENQNMPKPIIRITSVEDERVERFLNENVSPVDSGYYSYKPNAEILKKSQTMQQLLGNEEDIGINVNSLLRYHTENASPDYVKRRDSLASNVSTDSFQIEFKHRTESRSGYNREDSLKSNLLFERSLSQCSDLEYIKGREDWKDYQPLQRYDINEQIDSDNYHHLRRFSEAADTLEYIRGRADWFDNEVARRTSLPKIHEHGSEQRMFIQDEIDSDEYHHDFFMNDAFRSHSERRHHTNVSDSNNFIEQYFLKGDTNELMTPSTYYNDTINPMDATQTNLVENFIENERKSAAKDPITPPSLDDSSSLGNSNSGAANVCYDEQNREINEVIEDLIKHNASTSEDIEITVLNLAMDTSKTNKTDDKKNDMFDEPFIIISDATDDGRELSMDNDGVKRDSSNEKIWSDVNNDEQKSNNTTKCNKSDNRRLNATTPTQIDDNTGESTKEDDENEQNEKNQTNDFLNMERQIEIDNNRRSIQTDAIDDAARATALQTDKIIDDDNKNIENQLNVPFLSKSNSSASITESIHSSTGSEEYENAGDNSRGKRQTSILSETENDNDKRNDGDFEKISHDNKIDDIHHDDNIESQLKTVLLSRNPSNRSITASHKSSEYENLSETSDISHINDFLSSEQQFEADNRRSVHSTDAESQSNSRSYSKSSESISSSSESIAESLESMGDYEHVERPNEKHRTADFLGMETHKEHHNRHTTKNNDPNEIMIIVDDEDEEDDDENEIDSSNSANTENQSNLISMKMFPSNQSIASYKSLHYEDVGDLIREVSSGPWFHN